MQFPADKNQIIQFAQKATQDEEVLSQLRRIDERQYENVFEVTKAADLVQPKSWQAWRNRSVKKDWVWQEHYSQYFPCIYLL